jgi:hypothetical protein
MPAWMAGIGRWTPNGLAVVQVKQICSAHHTTGMFVAAVRDRRAGRRGVLSPACGV